MWSIGKQESTILLNSNLNLLFKTSSSDKVWVTSLCNLRVSLFSAFRVCTSSDWEFINCTLSSMYVSRVISMLVYSVNFEWLGIYRVNCKNSLVLFRFTKEVPFVFSLTKASFMLFWIAKKVLIFFIRKNPL